jgi:hypothetical protein
VRFLDVPELADAHIVVARRRRDRRGVVLAFVELAATVVRQLRATAEPAAA